MGLVIVEQSLFIGQELLPSNVSGMSLLFEKAPLMFRVSIFEVYFFMKKGGDLEWNFKLPSGLGGFG